eukprot:TRINITY_DN1077_c0_g1_i1.p1 TRINITY_DN1077_c0_g1~~TRINITY_DN1077_c0_g1_i1.p1  ORF type:complete len:645 (+),score=109.47 TRINITY_DN1077_c0_g1_i1:256-2190(+)
MEVVPIRVQFPTWTKPKGRLLINNGMSGCVVGPLPSLPSSPSLPRTLPYHRRHSRAATGGVEEEDKDDEEDEESMPVNDDLDGTTPFIFLLGGEAPDLSALKSYDYGAVLDLRTMACRAVRHVGGPGARSWGQLCILDETVYQFGGMCRPQDSFHNELFMVSARSLSEAFMQPDPVAEWDKVTCSGDIPCPRACSTFTPLPRQQSIILVGGGSWEVRAPGQADLQMYDDVHQLCVQTNKWTQIAVQPDAQSGESMSRRWGHTAVKVGRSKLFIWGGQDLVAGHWYNDMWILDTERWSWTQPKITGTPPVARHGHSATLVNDEMIVVGGWGSYFDLNVFFNDVHSFNVKTHTWRQIHLTSLPARGPAFLPELSGHFAAYVEKEKNLYLAAGIIDCNRRTVNEHVYVLKVGPKRLTELCLEVVSRNIGTRFIYKDSATYTTATPTPPPVPAPVLVPATACTLKHRSYSLLDMPYQLHSPQYHQHTSTRHSTHQQSQPKQQSQQSLQQQQQQQQPQQSQQHTASEPPVKEVLLPLDIEELLTTYYRNVFRGKHDLRQKRWTCVPPPSPVLPHFARSVLTTTPSSTTPSSTTSAPKPPLSAPAPPTSEAMSSPPGPGGASSLRTRSAPGAVSDDFDAFFMLDAPVPSS